jgi:aspartyl-tRNA synthetase
MRTHTCGELNKSFKDQEVVLCGWVHRRRDHGKLIFIDIRDRYGITQVVFVPSVSPEAHTEAQQLGPEFVVKITGTVNVRPPKNVNPEAITGDIELLAKKLEILNTAKVPVFEIDDNIEAAEDLRLGYRYLDIRRKKVRDSLVLRHQICNAMRSFLNGEKFTEIETPVLTKSTPEGARDFLVPSRLNPGAFYALPQSPQLFKQILMVSGMDRYYQIVKCFRDEDLRADRQPEFTQLDMEMSFVDQDFIFDLTERMYKKIFKEVLNIDLPTPFPRMTHAQAMAKYNSDKPDIRQDKSNSKEFAFLWVVDFPLFKYNTEEKRWDSEHHPFTGLNPEDVPLLESGQYANIRGRCYDLVLNGNEIGSGSVRIHRRELQQKIFDIIGIAPEEALKRFGFLLKAFEYGAPPHAGVAYGIDRIVTIITGNESIRDCIAFPKTQKGTCLMTEAPSDVDEKQLKDLGLVVFKK